MTVVTLLVFLILTVPIFGLAVLGWLAMEDEAGDLCAMANLNGFEFDN